MLLPKNWIFLLLGVAALDASSRPLPAALIARFRADDPAIVTTGSKVAVWPNQANPLANASGGAPMKSTATINGLTKDVLNFDGSLLQAALTQTPSGSAFFVLNNLGPGGRVIGWENAEVGDDGLGILTSNHLGNLQVIARNNFVPGDIDTGSPLGSQFEILSVTWGADGVWVARDGVILGHDTNIDRISRVPGHNYLRIGAPLLGSFGRYEGQLAEMQLWSSQLSAGSRQLVETELYERWFTNQPVGNPQSGSAKIAQFRADDPSLGPNGSLVGTWANSALPAFGASTIAPTKTTASIGGFTKSVVEFNNNLLQAPIAQTPQGTAFFVLNNLAAGDHRVVGWDSVDTGLGISTDFFGNFLVIARDNGAIGDVIAGPGMGSGFEIVSVTWGTGGVKVYRDGVLVGSNNNISSISQVPGFNFLNIGASLTGDTPGFVGQIAELQIWDNLLDNASRLAIEQQLHNRWFTAGAVPGDFDSDGDVDGADFVAWQTNFPKASGAVLAQGDADGDGDVDGADFVVWQTNFPFSPNPGAAVPEPEAGLLLLLAIPMLLKSSRHWCYRMLD
jgi:hypothetical protein